MLVAVTRREESCSQNQSHFGFLLLCFFFFFQKSPLTLQKQEQKSFLGSLAFEFAHLKYIEVDSIKPRVT